ncbi:hypothetical protein PTKIN_Ptkin18bG0123700 [Pterospermum kingtungense]
MAGTRGILGSLPMAKLSTKSYFCSHFKAHQQQNIVSSPNPLFYNSSNKSMLVQPRKVVAIPMAVAHIKDESVGAAAAETPVQYELKALVTVKYDTKEYLKDMMFRWLDSDAHTAQTAGVILQLVSTEVDPILYFSSFGVELTNGAIVGTAAIERPKASR